MLAQIVRLSSRLHPAKRTARFVSAQEHRLPDRISAYLRDRTQFPQMLNALDLVGQGVEVGVQCGLFSEIVLREWHGARLHCVDPWQEFPRDSYIDVSNVDQATQDEYYKQTRCRLQPFGERVRIIRKTSREAATEFSDRQLDFVYLDAQHHYQAVCEDIRLWFSKVRRGGILAGHDYVEGKFAAGAFGVKSAVDDFIAAHRLRLFVTREPDWPSWYVFL